MNPDRNADLRELSMALVSTYPPTRCGIGRFAASLNEAWRSVAPATRVSVVRIAGAGEQMTSHPDVQVVFDPTSPVAIRTAARHLNRHDVAVIQHEFGLYGPEDGIAVVDLVERTSAPVVTVLHTVLADPTPRQHTIITHLAGAGSLVVPTEVARSVLVDVYGLSSAGISVIPHGSSLTPRPIRPAPRRRLITWGLLGPGKGIERSLRALAQVRLEPAATLDVVGQTHPKVRARSGDAYRSHLMRLTENLGLGERVRFVDRYLADDELQHFVARADAVVIPYDNGNQICSGVLTDAVALGRPVIATEFPHARELLASGAGLVVDHSDTAVAEAIALLLDQDAAYLAAAREAAEKGEALRWTDVASRYLDLCHSMGRGVSVA